MELRDYFLSYTRDELTKGAELYFSGEVLDLKCQLPGDGADAAAAGRTGHGADIIDFRRISSDADGASAYGRGEPGADTFSIRSAHGKPGSFPADILKAFDAGPVAELSMRFKASEEELSSGGARDAAWDERVSRERGRSDADANSRGACSIRIHEKLGLVLKAECRCAGFAGNGYGCEHTAALLTAYMIKRRGEDIFRNTQLEDWLRTLSMTDDPFAPGVMKRTDERLRSFISGTVKKTELPRWNNAEGKKLKKENFVSECALELYDGRAFMELKLGPGKPYVIRNLPELIRSYREQSPYFFGKKQLVIERKDCDMRTGRLLDFLSELMTERETRNSGDRGFYRRGNSGDLRFCELEPKAFNSFMEIMDGKTITIGEDILNVQLDRKALSATVKKRTHGASIKLKKAKEVFAAGEELYLRDRVGIFRVAAESAAQAKELAALLESSEELYVRESDMSAVVGNLITLVQKYGSVELKGLDIEDYEPEKPEFIFNLDYAENADDLLTCSPFAVYQGPGRKYPLYAYELDAQRRNGAEEKKAADILSQCFDKLDERTGTLSARVDEEEFYDFMLNIMPQLEELGTVMATEAVKRSHVKKLPKVKLGVSADDGNMLLSLKATGLSPLEMASILSSYSRKKKYFRLKTGEFVSVDENSAETWETLSELYRHYGKNDPEAIKLPLYRALYLHEMLEKREENIFDGNDSYRRLLQNMTEAGDAGGVPESLKGILRPYQTEGSRWIGMLKRCGFGGILADDMGLGKTVQVLSFLLDEKNRRLRETSGGTHAGTIIVCPASLCYNWQKEIEHFTPELTNVVVVGTQAQRKEIIEQNTDKDIYITSYDLLKRDISLYEGIHFENEIIDEAQYIKNQTTQTAQSVRIIDSSFRMALTGTPIENHLSELWSIMDYLMPGFLYQYGSFRSEYEAPIAAGKDEDALKRLRSMVHPFILRRLKKQVLKELPDKVEEVVSVKLEDEQKKLYDAHAEEIRLQLDKATPEEFKSAKFELLAQLTRLREVCCDPGLLYNNYSGPSAKLETCVQLVSQAVEGGHKLLLFSQFTSMLDIIEERLTKEGFASHRIDGSVSKEKRMEMVEAFAYDEVPVFLISLKAGGTGLNLTAADIVIHYDPWWNQAAQNQATDRTHRIGQTQKVTVYELIAMDTIEEKVQKIKESKAKLAEDVLSGSDISSTIIDKDALLALL